MSVEHFIELKEKFELQKYVRPVEIDKKEGVSFCGSPRKHPYDKKRVVLIADPLSENTYYYEFKIDDIITAEELPNIANIDGESVSMVRIWIRKKSIGMQCSPFIVDSISQV